MSDAITVRPLKRRTWAYVMQPHSFDVAPCSCGNHETQWSEYEGHLWCAKCEKDFVPEHNGILGGPVLPQVAAMMGIRFDIYHLPSLEVERFDLKTGTYAPVTSEVAG